MVYPSAPSFDAPDGDVPRVHSSSHAEIEEVEAPPPYSPAILPSHMSFLTVDDPNNPLNSMIDKEEEEPKRVEKKEKSHRKKKTERTTRPVSHSQSSFNVTNPPQSFQSQPGIFMTTSSCPHPCHDYDDCCNCEKCESRRDWECCLQATLCMCYVTCKILEAAK